MRRVACLIALSAILFSSVHAAETEKVRRSIHGLTSVTSIDVADYVDLVLDDRMADSISIEGGRTMMSCFSVKCTSTNLKLSYPGMKKEDAAKHGHVVVRMSPSALKSLHVKSNSSVVFYRPLIQNSLNCSFGPGCNVKGTLKVKSLKMSFQDKSSFNGSLFCQDVTISVSGETRCGINTGCCETLSLNCDGKAQFITDKLSPSSSFTCTAKGNSVVHIPSASNTSISLTDDARYEGAVQCGTLSLKMAGKAKATISGTTSTFYLDISGFCSFESPKFEVITTAMVNASETSKAEVYSSGNVTVKASDGARVRVPKCDGVLSISAVETSQVSYRRNLKVGSLKIKDQASTDIFD